MKIDILKALNTERAARRATVVVTDVASGGQRLVKAADVQRADTTVVRLGPPPVEPDALQRLFCTCAPIRDYTGSEVARVGFFGHGPDDQPILTEHHKGAWDLARRISMRLGHVPPHDIMTA